MRQARIIFAFVLFLAVQNQAHAQRRLPAQMGIQLNGGTVNGFNLDAASDGFGFHAGAVLTNNVKHGNYWKFGVEYLQKQYLYEDMKLPQAQFTGECGFFLNLLSDATKTVYFSLGASFLAGYETINWGEKLLPDGATILNRDAFIYGPALTAETEIYLSDMFSIIANVRERLLFGSTVGKFNTQIGIGIKYIIN